MNKMIDWRREWPALILILLAVAVTIWLYPRLPDPMPTHWNFQNEVDGYSSRAAGAWLMPLMAAGIYLLLVAIPFLDPRRENVASMADLYRLIRLGMTGFMTLLHIVLLMAVLYGRSDLVGRAVPAIVGLLFLLIGNYMPRMRPNWFMGIRTPWTLSSDTVWRKSHLLGGRLFMLAGVVMFLIPFLPETVATIALMAVILVAAFLPIVYSYVIFRREQAKTGLSEGE